MPEQDYDNDCVSEKMRVLKEEGGRSHDQMVAMAIEHCREQKKKDVSEIHTSDYGAEHETETMDTEPDECMKTHMANGLSAEEAKQKCMDSKQTMMEIHPPDSPNGTLEIISEFSMETRMQKGFPDVPLFAGVSLDEIKALDATPTFVTLQIAEIGRKSHAGYLYDEGLVSVIEQSMAQKRPGGIFGHPNPAEADYAYPDPDALWVGAKRQGKVLWGKAWLREPKAARRVRDVGLVGGYLGTSIFGKAIKEIKEGSIRLKDFVLERIDFAPIERASLPMSGQFALTAEMNGTAFPVEDSPVTIEELKVALAEHKPDVILNLLPVEAMERINEMVLQKNRVLTNAGDQELITQLAAQNEQAKVLIAEMQATDKTQKEQVEKLTNDLLQHDLDATVAKATDWVVTSDAGKSRLNALRSHLRMGLVAEMKSGEPLWDAMSRVMDNKNYSMIVEMTKKEIGGGALTTQLIDPRPGELARPTSEQITDARGRVGI